MKRFTLGFVLGFASFMPGVIFLGALFEEPFDRFFEEVDAYFTYREEKRLESESEIYLPDLPTPDSTEEPTTDGATVPTA